MSQFKAKLTIWKPRKSPKTATVQLLVDTGAGYSWVRRARLEALGIRPVGRMQLRTIEGRVVERDLAPVFVRANGQVGGDTVVLGERGDAEVFGSHTLESLGLAVDPVKKRLVPTIGLALRVAWHWNSPDSLSEAR